MSTPDLSLLLTRTAAGDREALRAIYESMRQPVYLYVLVQCGGNRPLAEDVLQDTFIGIWESAPRYQPTGSAKAWILAIARHQALKAQRREAAFVHPEEPFWEGVPSPEETTPETAAVGHQELLRLLCTLPERERAVVAGYVLAGFKHREIAAGLHIPLGTELWLYRRALGRLRALAEHTTY